MKSSNRLIQLAIALACNAAAIAGDPQTTGGASQVSPSIRVTVAAQPIAAALNEFARQVGLHVIIDSEVAGRITSAPLEGIYTKEAALAKLLENTGLRYQYLDEQTIAVLKSTPMTQASSSLPREMAEWRLAQAAHSVETGSEAVSRTDAALEEVVVTSKITFTQNDAFGATKMGLAIKDTPFSVLPITRDLMDMASIKSIGDIYKLDPSAASNQRDGGWAGSFSRGFRVSQRVDGFRDPFADIVVNDLVSYERVEVLKGGVSTIYGEIASGGVVNYVSKLPEAAFGARFRAEGGEHNYQRLEGDVTGSLFGSERWSYRVIAMGQYDDTFRDYSRDDRVALVPSIMYRGESSSFVLRGRFQHLDASYSTSDAGVLQLDAPLPAGMNYLAALSNGLVGLRYPDVPRSRWAAPIGAGAKSDVLLVQAQHDYTLPSKWKIRTNIQYSNTEFDRATTTVAGPYDIDGNPVTNEAEVNYLQETGIVSAEVNLFGDVNLFGRAHTLFFGIDYAELGDARGSLAVVDSNVGAANTVLNIFDPDYEAARRLVTLSPEQLNAFTPSVTNTVYFGTTAQLILKPLDRLSILLGGRFSSDHSGSASSPIQSGREAALRAAEGLDTSGSRTVFQRFSKQGGITYALTPQINAYGSYAESFRTSTSHSFVEGNPTGKLISPPLAETYEIGLKGEFADRWAFSAALFDLTEDAVIPDLEHATFSLVVPGWKSKGAEVSLQGRFLRGLNVFGGLSYLDAKYTQSPNKDLRSAAAPKLGGTLYATYEILGGSLRGLGFGGGVVHKAGRKGGQSGLRVAATGEPFLFDYGDFTEVDLRLFYNRDRWGLYGVVTNLFDERYASTAGQLGNLNAVNFLNPGRQVRVGATFNF